MRALAVIAFTVACFWYANGHDTFDGGVVFCCGCNVVWAVLRGFAGAAIEDWKGRRTR